MKSEVILLLLASLASSRAASYNSFPFLYAKSELDRNTSWPVQEHAPPKGGKKKLWNDHPDFLYKPNPGEYRVVEFYVHWCNICRHFSQHYVHHAKKTMELLKEHHPDINLKFHAVSCVPNRPLCLHQEVKGYPVVRLFRQGETKGENMHHSEVKPIAMLQKLNIDTNGMQDYDDEDWDIALTDPTKSDLSLWASLWNLVRGETRSSRTSTDRSGLITRTREDLKNDIHLSFDFAMRNGVYMADGEDVLTKEAKATLKQWIRIMRLMLPKGWTELQDLLSQLERNFQYISKKEAYLLKFLDKYPPKESEWSPSCSMNEAGRGYTCGLWEMFHSVSVGLVNYNRNVVEEKKLYAPETVAKAIRDYVEHFFGCEECRINFLTSFDACEFNRCDRLKTKAKFANGGDEQEREWGELSSWLYEVHNSVNVRLMNEAATRQKKRPTKEDTMNAHWPSDEDCASCWVVTNSEGKRQWNETVVSQYLKLEYGRTDTSMVEFQRQLFQETSNGNGNRVRVSNRLPRSLVFYFFVGAVAIVSRRIPLMRRLFRRKLRNE